jgi:hypothetical protein
MLKKYSIPSERGEGWAVIVIDTETGFFATVSDWGNYAYQWTHPGREFREFLIGLTPDYLHKKLLHGRGKNSIEVFDGERTLATIKEALDNKDRAHLKEKNRSWKRYNPEVRTLEKFTPMEQEDFDAWCSDTTLDEPWQYRCTQPEPQAMSFCTKVWPRFKLLLEGELLKEGIDVHAT